MLSILLRSFRDLLFPPLCLDCRETIENESSYLCNACVDKLQLIDPAERCPHCFSSDYNLEFKRCLACNPNESHLRGIAATFDYIGPAASIIRKLKYSNQPYLAKGAGAYLVAQLIQIGWPLPDLIAPVPISLTHWLDRGYNQSELLAESVSNLINKPHSLLLQRKSGDYSQAGMNQKQRRALLTDSLSLKNKIPIYDKTILLVDDVMTTGSTLQRCAEVLQGGCPKEIYALTFCRAIN